MLFRIFVTAIVAGLIGGAVATIGQELGTIPLILKAEVYEGAHDHAAPETSNGGSPTAQLHTSDAWGPRDGFERLAYTFANNVITAIAFALLLSGAFAVLESLTGRAVDPRRAAAWGLAGFAVFSFIPAIGLPPELPGMVAADVAARQIWWWSSVVASSIGLGLLAFAPNAALKSLGIAIIALPFAIGAPQSAGSAGGSAVPPELAAQFVVTALATALVFWLALSVATALVFAKLRRRQETVDRNAAPAG